VKIRGIHEGRDLKSPFRVRLVETVNVACSGVHGHVHLHWGRRVCGDVTCHGLELRIVGYMVLVIDTEGT
jgi:hypothetical protein